MTPRYRTASGITVLLMALSLGGPAVLLFGGCNATVSRIDYGGIQVERGMTGDDVKRVMGTPDRITHGADEMSYVHAFPQMRIRRLGRIAEWVWLRSDPIVIVWLDRDRVVAIGTLPREAIVGVDPPHAARLRRLARRAPDDRNDRYGDSPYGYLLVALLELAYELLRR